MLPSKQRTPSESKYLLLMFPINLTFLVFSYSVASVTTFLLYQKQYMLTIECLGEQKGVEIHSLPDIVAVDVDV